MKILVTMLAVLFLFSAAFAQAPISQGSAQLGGGISFLKQSGDLYENSDGSGITTFTVNPSIGYFIVNGFELGGLVEYSAASQGGETFSLLSVGPQVSYWFRGDYKEVKGSIYPYCGAFLQYSLAKHSVPEMPDYKASLVSIGGFAGVTYMLSNAVGAFGQVQYTSDMLKPDEAVKSVNGNSIGVFTGFNFFLY